MHPSMTTDLPRAWHSRSTLSLGVMPQLDADAMAASLTCPPRTDAAALGGPQKEAERQREGYRELVLQRPVRGRSRVRCVTARRGVGAACSR